MSEEKIGSEVTGQRQRQNRPTLREAREGWGNRQNKDTSKTNQVHKTCHRLWIFGIRSGKSGGAMTASLFSAVGFIGGDCNPSDFLGIMREEHEPVRATDDNHIFHLLVFRSP